MKVRVAALAMAGLVVAGTGTAFATAAERQALPAANMEAVIKAAQIDPRRPDQALTPGAKASVLLVEQALADETLLDAKYVDGHFGTSTVDAYAAYQRKLGYEGLAASGLPGKTSLAKLGAQRFTVTRQLDPGDKVTEQGQTINTRTKAMLAEAAGTLGYSFTITQGSYNPGGDPTSAGTHDGGGVVDLSVDGLSGAERTTAVRTLREVGFAAWLRTPEQGDWDYHIHAVALADTDQSPQAQHQAGDYYLGKNGLADGGKDDGPKVDPIVTWEEYQRG